MARCSPTCWRRFCEFWRGWPAPSSSAAFFFFLMIRRPPRSTLFPTRRSSDLITRAGGICSIIVEQNAQKILGLADRVVILERGTIVHDAASAALKADPAALERFLGVAGAAAH